MAAQVLEWRQRNKNKLTTSMESRKTMKMTQLLNTKQHC